MRILYRYNTLSCLLDLILQGKDVEEATVINADYCTAPSGRSEYILSGLRYHGNYEFFIGSLYSIDNYTEQRTFGSYPELTSIFQNFMNNSPYRSVWIDSDCDGTKDALSPGNSVTIGKTIKFNEDQTIILGVFGDNQFDINYDGTKIVDGYSQGQDNFKYLHLFPVDVTAGSHYFSFTGIGDGSVNDALGVIIWDNTYEDLITPIPRTSWNVLYSSEDSLTEAIDIVECPDGYSYDNDTNECIKIISIDSVTTQDYVLVTPALTCTGSYEIDTWTIDYGDGNSESGTGDYDETFIHQYTSPDTYTITFTIITTTGKTFTDTDTVTVDFESCVEYGYLYNWYAVDNSTGDSITSSDDYRIPTDADIQNLINYVGTSFSDAGGYLKDSTLTYWASPNTDASDSYGFSAVGSGNRLLGGSFEELMNHGGIWTSIESGTSGKRIEMYNDASNVGYGFSNKKTGYAVRLVSDATGLLDGTTTTYTGNDGKEYNAIVINELYWTTENLAETEYRNGDPIPTVEDATTWSGLSTGAKCAYDNDYSNVGCGETG